MKTCKMCGILASDNAMSCPKCSANIGTSLSVTQYNARRQFTRMLWIYVTITIACIIVGCLQIVLFPTTIYSHTPQTSINIAIAWFGLLVLLPAGLTAMIAIFKFKDWGRKLWLVTTCVGLLLTLGMRTHTFLPIVEMLDSVSRILNGVLLAMMWLEPYSSLFNKKVKN